MTSFRFMSSQIKTPPPLRLRAPRINIEIAELLTLSPDVVADLFTLLSSAGRCLLRILSTLSGRKHCM